ncbi:matrixin family metalloprotease [Pseudarthrobacter sp. NIBRBAC000502770]|nr:matrixin family metalloprotease [Pseudarthrobacter sp. NIBRBAC000502770]
MHGYGKSSRSRPDIPGELAPPNVRRSPSGRIPQWAIDEAFGKAETPPSWRAGPPRPRRKTSWAWSRKRGRPQRSMQFKTVLGIVLVVCLYFSPALFDRLVLPVVAPYLPGAKMPPPGYEAASAPLGTPPASTGSTAFVLQESPRATQPVIAYDPCRPVHYVVRPDNALPGGDVLIREAVAAVSQASGLQFVDDGPTTEAPSDDRSAFQPDRYGKRWVPLLIAWSTPVETPGLAGNVAGLGGSAYVEVAGHPLVLEAGQVRLDAPDLAGIIAGRPDGAAEVRAIIMHELGHVLGLDHVNDPTQLMYAENMGVRDFAAGDRAGLALLGSGPCVPQL